MQTATSTSTFSTRFDPLSPEQREDPFGILAAARREQPVFYAPGLDLWVVTRYDDVLAVLKDHETFSSTGALKSALLPDAVAAVLAEGYRDMPYIILYATPDRLA
jgi:cytochrome P450